MSNNWFRELEATGKGPDWFFNAAFAPGSAAGLAAAFRALAPQGFTRYEAHRQHCPIHQQKYDYVMYIDSQQHAAIVRNIEGDSGQNVYIFHTIQACQNDLQIMRGYGGYPGQHGAEETRVIRALAQAPDLALEHWNIGYGGMGYPFEILAQGSGATTLLRYLDRP
ncbi:hypothetical protein SE17_20350 [Kouleothrix aurantiaca]|uniref:Uncharacterized protein n=1 Tax=Kouleothrix aurantiaca TaxID=186479 RepID=A0A0P9HB00_9CHLR|nr:hypothetical protein SE17_20350 [Kouleothrix aurantiaca]